LVEARHERTLPPLTKATPALQKTIHQNHSKNQPTPLTGMSLKIKKKKKLAKKESWNIEEGSCLKTRSTPGVHS